MPFLPKFIRSTHTVHVGGSRFLDGKPFDEARNPPGAIGVALQCFSSILIIGSFETASTFALFFLLFLGPAQPGARDGRQMCWTSSNPAMHKSNSLTK